MIGNKTHTHIHLACAHSSHLKTSYYRCSASQRESIYFELNVSMVEIERERERERENERDGQTDSKRERDKSLQHSKKKRRSIDSLYKVVCDIIL